MVGVGVLQWVLKALHKGQVGQEWWGDGAVCEGGMCIELIVVNYMVGSLWVRIKGQENKADVVGFYYRPPSQNNDMDELFFKEVRYTSRSATLVLVGDFSLQDVNWDLGDSENTLLGIIMNRVD